MELYEIYQCPGCVGCDDSPDLDENGSCKKHCAGTMISGIGSIFLGLPKGFNRKGPCDFMELEIYKSNPDWDKKYNIPVWKYLDGHGNTIVRGISPRINGPYLYIVLGDVRNELDCLEITNEDINEMD